MELALANAGSAKQELMVERLYASVLYLGCFSSYYYVYLDGDTERIAVLAERYEKAMDIAGGYRDISWFPIISEGEYHSVTYSPTLEEAAWLDWVNWFDDIIGSKLPEDAPVIKK